MDLLLHGLDELKNIRLARNQTTNFIEILEKVLDSDFILKGDITPENFITYYQSIALSTRPPKVKTILTLNEREVYRVLKEIANIAYPDKKISYFRIKIIPKESRSIHGDYDPSTKEIRIFNLSRKTAYIIKTTIHELAHHCQCCIEGSTGHDKGFYRIFKHLLETAHRMGVIDLSKTLDEIDTRDLRMLEKNCGKLQYEEQEKEDVFIIKVFNSYDYKAIIKEKGYSYSSTEKAWVQEFSADEIEKAKEFLKSNCPNAKIEVVPQSDYEIVSIYYMIVGKRVPVSNDEIKKAGFFFNEKYGWVKKIKAEHKDDEEMKWCHRYRTQPRFVGSL